MPFPCYCEWLGVTGQSYSLIFCLISQACREHSAPASCWVAKSWPPRFIPKCTANQKPLAMDQRTHFKKWQQIHCTLSVDFWYSSHPLPPLLAQVLLSSASQSVAPRPAASPRNAVECRCSGPNPDSLNQKLRGWGQQPCF